MKTIRYMLLVVLVAACTITRSQPSLPMKSNPSISLKNQFHNDQTLHRSKTLLPHLSKFFPSDDDADLHQIYDAQLPRLKGKHIQAWEKTRHLKDHLPSQASQQATPENVPTLDGLSSNSIISSTSSDSLVQAWAVYYASNMIPSADAAYAIATDDQGNVYVTGESDSTFTYVDIETKKYSPSGTLLWSRRYNGPGYDADVPFTIAVDSSGNVYVAGMSIGRATLYDYVTIKYNTNGVEQWVARYDGPDHDWDIATALAVDREGSVYVGGGSCGLNSYYDYATIKYNSSGVEQWVARYNGSLDFDDGINSLTLDSQGNVYVTGMSNSLGESANIVTIKYSADGIQQWIASYNGPGNYIDEGYSIIADRSDNIYVIGYSFDVNSSGYLYADYVTIKYASDGTERWVKRYNGPGDRHDVAMAIAADYSGNVYVGGRSYNAFPSPYFNFCTIKYDSAGIQKWISRYDGGYLGDDLTDLTLDGGGNVYVTGYSYVPKNEMNYVTIKYRPDGTQAWIATYDGPGLEDYPSAICADELGNVYVTGKSKGVGTYYDWATVKYSTSGAQQWAARYNGAGGSDDFLDYMAVDVAGNVYEAINGRLIKYTTEGELQLLGQLGIGRIITMDSMRNWYVCGSNNLEEIITAKYDSNGVQKWVSRWYGDVKRNMPTAIATDNSGNVYVTGWTNSLTTGGNYVVIKYNTLGVQQWAVQYSGIADTNSSEFPVALAIDKSGNVYVTGYSGDYITVKLDLNGQIIWDVIYDGPDHYSDTPSDLVVDDSGNVYVTGTSTNAYPNGYDYATIKYNTHGVEQWATRKPGSWGPMPILALDKSSNVYVTGNVTMKYNADGVQQWAINVPNEESKRCIELDVCGNIYVSGYYPNTDGVGVDILTIKYNPDGQEMWKAKYDAIGYSGDEYPRGIGIDAQGNVYVGSTSRIGSGFGFYAISTIKYTPVPILALDQNNVVFGDIDITCTQTDTITLYPHACITPASISILSDDPNFSAQALGSTSSSISFLVKFHPQSNGPKSGHLTFTHITSGSFATLSVNGTGAFVPPNYSTQSIAFDTSTVGCQKERIVTVINRTCVSLNILSAFSTDSNFSIILPSAVIGPFDSKIFNFIFAPLSIGLKSGEIIFIHDQEGSPDTIQVSGTGVGTGSEIVVRNNLGEGWQMISLPVESFCPRVLPNSFSYDGSYILRDTLIYGKGYWNKLAFPILYFAGNILTDITTSVISGWNIIGSISVPIQIANITSQPEGIISSPFFGYTSSSYQPADTIEPGHGYWVKVSQNGELILQDAPSNQPKQNISDLISISNVLTFTDSSGKNQRLYFTDVSERKDLDFYELPPSPPIGIFDARFTSGRLLETLNNVKKEEFPIILSSAQYPVTVTWTMREKNSAVLRIDDKKVDLQRNYIIQIFNPESKISLALDAHALLPTTFSLAQNYPNPFNPITTIKYGLPFSSNVKLKIFNVLGQVVATLRDEEESAGYKQIEWNSSAVASGIYFYRLDATSTNDASKSFTQVKKMLLLK